MVSGFGAIGAAAPSADGGRRAVSLPDSEPLILTDRLVLAPVTAADEQELWELHRDPEAFVADTTEPLTHRDQMVWLLRAWQDRADAHGAGYWTLRLPAPAAPLLGVIGLSALHEAADPTAPLSLYYRLRPDAQGHGYAAEAIRALLADPVHGPVGRELLVITDPANLRSLTLASRLGFAPAPPSRPVPSPRPRDILLIRPASHGMPDPSSSPDQMLHPDPASTDAQRSAHPGGAR